MPQLDPEAGIPAIQLVHPEIDSEQLLELYLEVYKLHRLPGSPPGEPTILEEISSVLPHHPPEEKGMPDIQKLVSPEGFHSPWNRLSLWAREDSIDRSLARVHEAHRKALLTVATLEEEMERLYRKKAHSSPGQKQRDSCGPDHRSRKRQHEASFCSQPTAGRSANMPSSRTGSEGADSDLGEPPQLQANVASFLQGSSKMTKEESKEISLEPPVSQPAKWVRWKAEKCDVPEWWVELSTVPVEDIEKLARQVRASFKLPKHMHELDPKEAPFHAPLASPCLHRWRFMPPIVSAFVCWDIWEIPREKMVTYA